jgi:hypothetical protein
MDLCTFGLMHVGRWTDTKFVGIINHIECMSMFCVFMEVGLGCVSFEIFLG